MKFKKQFALHFAKILQHISLEKFFSVQGVACIHIFLFQGIAFPKNLFHVSFEKNAILQK